MLIIRGLDMNRYNWKIGISVHFDEHFDENVDAVCAAGFDAIDFDLCIYWTNREREIGLYKHLEKGLEKVQKSGLYFNAVHVSFGPNWDISKLDENERIKVVERVKEIFNRCNPYKPYTYVIHGSYGTITPENRPAKIEQLRRSLSELRACTDSHIALETLPRHALGNTADEIISIVDATPGIDVCVDTNHFLQEKTEDAIRKIGRRIRTTHISDHDYIDEKHWMPGEGKIDWQAVIKSLEDTDYDGVWTYELGLNTTKTISRPRPFTYDDFIKNARELFNKEKITVIGTPKSPEKV